MTRIIYKNPIQYNMKHFKEKREKDGRDKKKAENQKVIKEKELLASDGVSQSKKTEKSKEKSC